MKGLERGEEKLQIANCSWGMSGRSPPKKNKKEVIL
jgi:hypothetical protein